MYVVSTFIIRISFVYRHLIDPAAGASDDWYKGVLGARFVYTTELRDTGLHGFRLPPSQIIPSGEELWAAFKIEFEKMIELTE